jgi:hypothetical protein
MITTGDEGALQAFCNGCGLSTVRVTPLLSATEGTDGNGAGLMGLNDCAPRGGCTAAASEAAVDFGALCWNALTMRGTFGGVGTG